MPVDVKLDPKAIVALNRGDQGRSWRQLAKKIESREGDWQLVEVVPLCSKASMGEKREHIRASLRAVGCRAQVVALQGMNINQRPWSGWAVYARIPR